LDLRERLDGVRRVAVLLVDGLGYHLLPLTRPVAPVLAGIADGRAGTLVELTCGLPSTTPTSLVSLGTGAMPGAHGVLGFTVKLPGSDQVLNHVEWRDDPDPQYWQPVRTQFEVAAAAGKRVAAVSRPDYAGSGLTVAAYRGATYVGAADLDALGEQMSALLHGGADLVYGYHSALDGAAHLHGIDSPQWMHAASDVDRLIERLVDGLPADAALLVTADHGGLDIPDEYRIDLDDDPRLAADVRVVSGDPRLRYLHTRPGARDDVIAVWRSVLGPAADVVSRDDAVAAGWFGPVPEAHLPRIGDVVVACRERYAVVASQREKDTVAKLVAYHGSFSEQERAIPLIVHSGR
jgi:predicted AlkP superfamily pyrophosphatase or phosphodiesterase